MLRRITFAISLLIIALACAQFHGEPISVASHRILEPPEWARHTEDSPVADELARAAIAFDLPDSLLQPTTAIVEAFLIVKIIPDEELSERQTLDIFCIPQTESLTSASVWTSITDELLTVSEVGTYDPESGEVFFEISTMLQSASDDIFRFRGLILVPAENSPTFRISSEPDAISLKCEYRPGKREVR